MFNKRIIALAVLLTLTLACVYTTHAQISDISDDYWSIDVPSVLAVDVDMGQVVVHQSRDLMVTSFLTNTGSVAISIEAIVFEGADADAFALVSGIPPFEIPRGETKAVEFRFSPYSAGEKTATVLVHTQVGTLTQSIRGEAVMTQFEVFTELVDFGQVSVGSSKDTTITAVVRNISSFTLTVSHVEQLGPDIEQFFLLSGGGAFALAPGDTRAMELRFAPTVPGRTSGSLGLYHDGVASPVVLQLFGEGTTAQAMAVLGMDTIRARAGELVEVPVYLREQQNLAISGVTGFNTELRFNATLLSPSGATPQGMVIDGERRILLEGVPVQADAQGVLTRLSFVAMLGDAEGTPLHLEHSFAVGGNVVVTEIPGYFLLTDICHEGGTRLYHSSGVAMLRQNRPNPFNTSTIIEYEVVEIGPTRLYVMDLLGRTVAVLVDGIVDAGRYSVTFDASAMASGTYLYVLQTPAERFLKLMEVVK